jgi:predicted porin
MNKKIGLAVATAVLAMGASAANAGIVIPAGDWTVDINGNVNAFYIYNNSSDSNVVGGGLANTRGNADSASSINTGLLPSWLGITGKKRENDLDISWTISLQPGASSAHALQGGGGSEFRQANITFGDKSWGTIKLGKDLGVFGADAILNDQTLLGVGSQGVVGAHGGTTTTLGRIGTGFLYADFKGQINYTSPNWNGFQFTAGIAQPWATTNLANSATTTDPLLSGAGTAGSAPAFEGVASYSWTGDFSGKVWLEGFTQHVAGVQDNAEVFGLGASVNFQGFNLVGYYYDGSGVGTTCLLCDGYSVAGAQRDSDGGYIQGSYKIPGVGTKIAASWGQSNLDLASGEALVAAGATTAAQTSGNLVKSNEMWTVGVYHPLTSNLNLVAEYSNVKAENQSGQENESDIVDFGAILFF